MLKVRLQGTKNDIRWFLKILDRDRRVRVENTSTFFDNKGTKKYKRLYTEIFRKEENASEKEQTREPESNYCGSGRKLSR